MSSFIEKHETSHGEAEAENVKLEHTIAALLEQISKVISIQLESPLIPEMPDEQQGWKCSDTRTAKKNAGRPRVQVQPDGSIPEHQQQTPRW
jgi:hypothetical protein